MALKVELYGSDPFLYSDLEYLEMYIHVEGECYAVMRDSGNLASMDDNIYGYLL